MQVEDQICAAANEARRLLIKSSDEAIAGLDDLIETEQGEAEVGQGSGEGRCR